MNRPVQTAGSTTAARIAPVAGSVMELFRFGIVGVTINLALYLAYLMLTHMGMDYRISMSVIYIFGTVLGFVLHRNWTFRSQGAWGDAFGRYVVAYASGYVLNLAGLWILVEAVNLSHALAQGAIIFAVAAYLFVLQKFWIFAKVA
jgi:putative flippase GtrA